MTLYKHGRPVAQPSRPDVRALAGIISAAAAASWAFAAMAAAGALGVHLLGWDGHAHLASVTAALMVMAVGGQVRPTGDVSVFGLDAATASGSIDIMPLGLTLLGALVFGWLFTAPLRRRAAVTRGELAVRGGAAVVAFLALLGVVDWAADGSVSVGVGQPAGGGAGSGGSGGIFGGLSGLVGGELRTSAQPTVGFNVALAPTLAAGLLWAVAVLALSYAAARRAPLPAAWRKPARTVRPAASAVATVYLGAVMAGAFAAIAMSAPKGGLAKTVGGVLLGTPNGVFFAVLLGMGVPLDGKASGPLTHFLPSPVNQFLAAGHGTSITVPLLARLDGRVWLLPVAVALMLLATGVIAAVRTPRPASTQGAAQEVGGAALRLSLALGVATPVLLALADVNVNADLSVFGFQAAQAGLSLTGNIALALVLGLVEGAAFGALGALLVRRFAPGKRARPVEDVPLLTPAAVYEIPPNPPTTQP